VWEWIGAHECDSHTNERKWREERIQRKESSNLPPPLSDRVCRVIEETTLSDRVCRVIVETTLSDRVCRVIEETTLPLYPLSPVTGCSAVSLADRLTHSSRRSNAALTPRAGLPAIFRTSGELSRANEGDCCMRLHLHGALAILP
jgi:hypothetical protein